MKLRAKRGFYDKKDNCYRPTGEVFDVAKDRAKEILAAGVAEVVETSAEPVKPKRKTNKG